MSARNLKFPTWGLLAASCTFAFCMSQAGGMATDVSKLAQPESQTQQIARGEDLPMEIAFYEELGSITVPDRNTTTSAYGGRLRRYDVHIAKMFEITYYFCKEPSVGGLFWQYSAGNGSINMGMFEISCNLANDIAFAYGVSKTTRTTIRFVGEEGYRDVETYDIPVFNIEGGKVDRWMNFTRNFRPVSN